MSDDRLAPEWVEKRNELRERACCGDSNALMFLSTVMDAVEIWDDLVDKDKEVKGDDINRVFLNLMFFMPQNPFFERNKGYLLPVMMTCINAWLDSNDLQKSPVKRDLQAAWWLKQMGVELYGSVAFLMGGFSHMREISLEARTLLAHEDFADFLQEHNHA
jgi:hypothetical protein